MSNVTNTNTKNFTENNFMFNSKSCSLILTPWNRVNRLLYISHPLAESVGVSLTIHNFDVHEFWIGIYSLNHIRCRWFHRGLYSDHRNSIVHGRGCSIWNGRWRFNMNVHCIRARVSLSMMVCLPWNIMERTRIYEESQWAKWRRSWSSLALSNNKVKCLKTVLRNV